LKGKYPTLDCKPIKISETGKLSRKNNNLSHDWRESLQGRQPRYKLDLSGLHAECEANYARLMRLFPGMDTEDRREFQLGGEGVQSSVHVCLEVTERCPYTTMITVSQHQAVTRWVEAPRFAVRLYRDANMAEVVEYSGLRRVSARYDYPNDEMHQKDEKHQLNRFLGEWLSHCVAVGRSLETTETCEW
jgi:uncharacterized protein YqiB (DUF1249 family)